MEQELALENLFLHLIRAGFPLGVRDYEDGLAALRAGYGLERRENLLRLCCTLWTRTDEEIRFLTSLFERLRFPTVEEIKNLTGDAIQAPLPTDDADFSSETGEANQPEKERANENNTEARMPQFASPTVREGLGLKSAKVEQVSGEYFILQPRLPVSLRRLIIIWRRFRVAKREGVKAELDVPGTIERQCRQGIISEPVMAASRRNQARLVVLIDVSDSMLPWLDFIKVVVESLRKGQLGEAKIFYFHNAFNENLYERETLTTPKPIAEALRENAGYTLLIISDGGAARGSLNRERIVETKEFLAKAAQLWHPVAWLNPMPSARWAKTTAETISRLPVVKMYQLNEEGLIKAIDVLRGKRID